MYDLDLIGAENREQADRAFRIGGTDFTFRAYLHPSVAVDLDGSLTDAEWLAKADEIITTKILENGQEDAWAKVRSADAERPISVYEISSIIQHAISVTSGRPTPPSSASSPTPSRRGTSSTEKSASPAEGA